MLRGLTELGNKCEPVGLGWVIAFENAPTDAQRAALVARARHLDLWLAPARTDDVRAEIAAIFAVMKSKSVTPEQAGARLKMYCADLGGLPLFAVQWACAAFRRGTIGDGEWAPEPGPIYQAATRRLREYAAERLKITKVIDAKVAEPITTSPERRKQVADQARAEIAVAAARAGLIEAARIRARHEGRDIIEPEVDPDAHLSPQKKAEKWVASYDKSKPLGTLSPRSPPRHGLQLSI